MLILGVNADLEFSAVDGLGIIFIKHPFCRLLVLKSQNKDPIKGVNNYTKMDI